jgi:DNA-binding response OmpR family regulator
MKGDEKQAMAAGCDGYITKPVDTRTLPVRLREYLGTRKSVASAVGAGASGRAVEPEPAPLSNAEMDALRRRFLDEGLAECHRLLDSLSDGFELDEAQHHMHQWVGTGGLLGYPGISRRAREIEETIRERPVDMGVLREMLTELTYAFDESPGSKPASIPDAIADTLAGKRIALIGFGGSDADRLCSALARVRAVPMLFPGSESPESSSVRGCDLILIHVRSGTLGTQWLAPGNAEPGGKPAILVGDRESLFNLDYSVQRRTREFLIDAWQPEEALMRASVVLSRGFAPAPVLAASGARVAAPAVPVAAHHAQPHAGRSQVVLADDDTTVLALVRATMMNHGIDVRTATNGLDAMRLLETSLPDAAILDVNMPGMDGFELLSAIRSRAMPVQVILLTARQQEGDLVRGFALGADDYVIKPFSPMELMARLKRLLRR